MSELYAPVERLSAPQIVTGRLKKAILDGEIPQGSRLPSERELAQRMQVSRPVIREAVVMLAAYGLIVSRQGEGNFVADKFPESVLKFMGFSSTLTEENYSYFFDCRSLFEKGMVPEIIKQATEEDIENLREINRIFCRKASAQEYVHAEIEFHRGFMELSHNPLVSELYTMILKFMHVSASFLLSSEVVREEAFSAHTRILDALKDRDEAACIEAIDGHLETARSNLRRYFERQGGTMEECE